MIKAMERATSHDCREVQALRRQRQQSGEPVVEDRDELEAEKRLDARQCHRPSLVSHARRMQVTGLTNSAGDGLVERRLRNA